MGYGFRIYRISGVCSGVFVGLRCRSRSLCFSSASTSIPRLGCTNKCFHTLQTWWTMIRPLLLYSFYGVLVHAKPSGLRQHGQVRFLERLLPLMENLDEANSELQPLLAEAIWRQNGAHLRRPYLVPAEVQGRLMKPPKGPQSFSGLLFVELFGRVLSRCTILDPQDFLIQEVFGARGDAWPKLGSHHQFHFPSKALSSTVPALSDQKRFLQGAV